jgi:hypothetical protein
MSDKKDSIFTSKSDAGKGDKPRNISKKFWENYGDIEWNSKKPKENEGKKNKQI